MLRGLSKDVEVIITLACTTTWSFSSFDNCSISLPHQNTAVHHSGLCFASAAPVVTVMDGYG